MQTSSCIFGLSCDALTAYSTAAIAVFTVFAALAAAAAAIYAYRTYRHDTSGILRITHAARPDSPFNAMVYVMSKGMVADGMYGVMLRRKRISEIEDPERIKWFEAKNIGRGVLLGADVVPLLLGEWKSYGTGIRRDSIRVQQGSIFVDLGDGPYTFGLLNELTEGATQTFWGHVQQRGKYRLNRTANGCVIRQSGSTPLVGANGRDPERIPPEHPAQS